MQRNFFRQHHGSSATEIPECDSLRSDWIDTHRYGHAISIHKDSPGSPTRQEGPLARDSSPPSPPQALESGFPVLHLGTKSTTTSHQPSRWLREQSPLKSR